MYWAVGSGYGHLTRALGFIHTRNLQKKVMVASQLPEAAKILGGLPLLQVPGLIKENGLGIRSWLLARIAEHGIDTVIVDAFPAGLYGEWQDLPAEFAHLRFEWVARYLKWEAYRGAFPGSLPRYKQVWEVEPVPKCIWAEITCAVAQLELRYPALSMPAKVLAQIAALPRPHWLLAHSGPVDEVEALLAHARALAKQQALSPSWIVISPEHQLDSVDLDLQLTIYPAWPLFQEADCVVTACGFNSMTQLSEFPNKHIFLPFPRRWDDQFLRFKPRP